MTALRSTEIFSSMRFSTAIIAICGILFAAFFGVAANILPWWLLAPIAILPIALSVGVKSPVAFISLGYLVVLFVPLYKIQDVCFILILGYGAFISIKNKSTAWLEPINIALAALLTIAAVSALLGFGTNGNNIVDIYNEGRVFIYWLACPLLLICLPRNEAHKNIKGLLIFIGLSVALLAVAQGFTGTSLLGTGRIAALDGSGATPTGNITRVQIAGFPFVQAALILIWADIVKKGSPLKLWKMLAMLILAAGIYYNFGRAVWAWTGVALVIVALASGARGWLTLISATLTFATVIILLKITINPIAIDVAYERLTSVGQEGGYGTSYGWRELENRAAVHKVLATFGMGVGVGGEYRDFYIPLRHFPDHVRYIHQGHLNLILKLSILGWLFVMGIALFAIQKAYKTWKSGDDSSMLAAGACIIAYLLLNNTQPLLMSYDGVMATSTLLALIFSSTRKERT